MDFPYLSVIVFLPAAGAVALVIFPRQPLAIKLTAAFFTFAAFALSLALFLLFNRSDGGFQFEEQISWIPSLNAEYHLGVDGLSLPLVLLTTLLGFLVVLISWKVNLRPREYFAWLLILETGILGVFTSLDLLLFFLFWEVELIPMYLLISVWGTGRKEYSAMKFVVYTLAGSAMMLTGILLLYFNSGQVLAERTFDIVLLAQAAPLGLPVLLSASIFFLLFVGFAVKLPMFPLHTWLPDAHTNAPTAVSVILAGVLLKMGGYGIIRFSVGLFPGVAQNWAYLLVIFAVVNILYGAAVTVRQTDLKRMIAYSSISHMGYVLLGIFALSQLSLTGATLQMVSHGLITGLLFAMVGLVYDKTHERQIPRLGGLARRMPVIVVVFSIAGLASLGLPGTSGFAAEFLVFLGSFSSNAFPLLQLYTILGVVGIVVTAGYILWMLEKVFYGPPKEEYGKVADADALEMVPIFFLMLVIVLIGVYPKILTDIISVAIMPIMGRFG